MVKKGKEKEGKVKQISEFMGRVPNCKLWNTACGSIVLTVIESDPWNTSAQLFHIKYSSDPTSCYFPNLFPIAR